MSCYCKWCGGSFSSLKNMASHPYPCNKNPNNKRHEPYEGGEKAHYYCKWCGGSFSSLKNMASHPYPCNKNPNVKRHEPAL
ncbi:MAG: hypothetical protein HDR54_05105 [Treponema sp.]|nr:hypothetical protein [Treponema sp.]